MVTKEQLAQLRAERSRPHGDLDYTIGGGIETGAHSSLDAKRERDIALGEMAMRDALRSMRIEHAISRHRGQAKAIFNTQNQEIKP